MSDRASVGETSLDVEATMRGNYLFTVVGLIGITVGIGGCDSDGLSVHERRSDYSGLIYSGYSTESNKGPATRMAVRAPMKIALVQIGEVAPPQSMLDDLRAQTQLCADVEPLPGMSDASPDSREIRWAAAPIKSAPVMSEEQVRHEQFGRMRQAALEMGMDYLLLVGGTVDHSGNATPLSIADITIVGAFVVPSREIHAVGRASGCLIDARSGSVIFIVSGDAEQKSLTPSASSAAGEDRVIDSVRNELITKIARRCITRLETETSSGTARTAAGT